MFPTFYYIIDSIADSMLEKRKLYVLLLSTNENCSEQSSHRIDLVNISNKVTIKE